MFKTPFYITWRFLKFALHFRRECALVFFFSILTVLLGLINPYLSKIIVDRAVANKDLSQLIRIAFLGGGIFFLQGLLNGRKDFLERYIKLKLNFALSKKLFQAMQKLPFSWFQNKSTGENLYKFDYDLEVVVEFVATSIPNLVYFSLKITLTLLIVFYLNWRLAVFSLLLAPFLYFPPYYFTRLMRKAWEGLVDYSEGIMNYLQEIFSHIQLIKVFGKETASSRHYLKNMIVKMRAEIKAIRLEILSSLFSAIANKIVMGLILFYGVCQVIGGSLTLGSLTAIMVYLTQLMAIQQQLASFFHTTTIGFISGQRIARILDEKSSISEVRGAKNVTFKKSGIEFQHVRFGYRKEQDVLRDLSFFIEGGSHNALVGASGCGKTTLLHLLVRVYDPLAGEIRIDGHDIKSLNLRSLREQVGFVLQDPFLWNDTIENNIRFAKEDATFGEITQAAQIVGLDEIIKELPSGYATLIGENASKLSDGQKQKIAIARALIKKPKILILDEAMSSMDSESEERIVYRIRDFFKETALITVSHRLSAVMLAEKALYFNSAGEFICDSPYNLLKYNEEFSNLFAGQKNLKILC